MTIESGRWYEATYRFRRGEGFTVLPECEPFDGKRMRFEALFRMDEDERYPLEHAMRPAPEHGFPRAWIASGDLADIVSADALVPEVIDGAGPIMSLVPTADGMRDQISGRVFPFGPNGPEYGSANGWTWVVVPYADIEPAPQRDVAIFWGASPRNVLPE